jgi:hypothetical protein
MYEGRLNLYMGFYRMQNLLSLWLKEQTVYECLIWDAALEWLVL